jgi:hypothetical protein
MANEVKIQKTVFNLEQFDKVVDREFNSYVQPVAIEEELSVEEFFVEYERLFNDIPIEGEVNSQEYLVNRGMELVDFEKDTEDIEPLLEEIAQLRTQILGLQNDLIEANNPDS